MKNRPVGLFLSVFACALLGASTAQAEHTRVTNPSALNLELLGKGLYYSVTFDQVVSDDLAAGFGIGSAPTEDGPNASVIPAYVNYYFTRDANSLFATVGGLIISNSDDVEGREAKASGLVFPDVPIVPILGLGFENRTDAGFLFRGTAYGISGEDFKPWVGFSFGYSF